MDLMQSPDQDAIQEAVRSFLAAELPMERVRKLGPAGNQALHPLWRQAADLGFFGLGVPENEGGAGYALTEEMILFEELGRSLAPGPWLGSVLAVHALTGAGGEPASWRQRILGGEVAVALLERPQSAPRVGGERLSGHWKAVLDGVGAGAFLVIDDAGVFLVPAAEGVRVGARPSLDPTRSLANVDLDRAGALRLTADGASIASLRCQGLVLACAEAVGGVQRTVEMSVDYAKVRHQFDRPIGSFQAVKHRCADMAVRAEVARSSTVYATVAVRDAVPDAAFQASLAKVLCVNAYVQNAADNVQNHGGMGFTWECDAHLFVKRARAFEQTFGSRTTHLDRIVAQLRAGGAA
jgi:alkylation response protein AidB-like acyl-CoA dehydrogenase